MNYQIQIRNQYGMSTKLSEMIEEAKIAAGMERNTSLKDVLDTKACNVFYERLAAAKDRGASEQELDAINAQDVALTLDDRVAHIARKWWVVQLVEGVVTFLTQEPTYPDALRY